MSNWHCHQTRALQCCESEQLSQISSPKISWPDPETKLKRENSICYRKPTPSTSSGHPTCIVTSNLLSECPWNQCSYRQKWMKRKKKNCSRNWFNELTIWWSFRSPTKRNGRNKHVYCTHGSARKFCNPAGGAFYSRKNRLFRCLITTKSFSPGVGKTSLRVVLPLSVSTEWTGLVRLSNFTAAAAACS